MQIVSIELAHDCTLVLYKQLIQTGLVLKLLPKFSELGFPLYEDTANGRATTHQLYRFAIEIGFAPMLTAQYIVTGLQHSTLVQAYSTGVEAHSCS